MNYTPDSYRRMTGWGFVAIQAAILLGLVLLPRGEQWSTPGWLNGLSLVVSGAGIVLAAAAALGLGRSLTPTPVPRETGELNTSGLYAFVRHPIYSGVLLIVLGIAMRSGSLFTIQLAVIAVAFFNVKARWEEGELTKTYSGYEEYARQTPRFIPRLPRRVAP